MTIAEVMMIGLGGFFGAILRFLVSRKLNIEKRFPLGTLIVNLVGSFLIGLIFGLALPKLWTLFLVSGFLGALTTFSTLQREVIGGWHSGKWKDAIFYMSLTYGGGILLALFGYLLGIFFL